MLVSIRYKSWINVEKLLLPTSNISYYSTVSYVTGTLPYKDMFSLEIFLINYTSSVSFFSQT